MRSVVSSLLFLLLSATCLAHGQGATIHGTVILPSGSVVPGASVTLAGPSASQSATTNQVGQYTIEGLKSGDYTVQIKAPGFEQFSVQVSVSSKEAREVDAVLVSVKAHEPAPLTEPQPAEAQAPTGAQAEATPVAQTGVVAPQAVAIKPAKGKAALYGIVTDQTGAVVQTATAAAAGGPGSTNSTIDTRGQYSLNNLAPGQYKLTVSAQGFAPFQTDITLQADQALEVDATLQPPSEVTNVKVEGQQIAQVQTETNQIEGTITNKEIVSTGLNGRNFTQLIALAPGVSNQTGQDEARVGLAGSVKYSVNGGRVEYNNFDVDGSDVLNAGLNGAESTLMVYPSLDAIQDVKVLTSNYGAMYGRSASGTVLVTTKSGTPSFHGGAYDFVRNEFFNARNYFDQTTKAPLYRRQDFGFDVGGPLSIPGFFNTKKDKTFFFFSEEFRLEKSPLGPGGSSDFNQAVPTLAERSGNFSDVCPFAPGSASVDFQRGSFPDCPAFGVAISGSGFRTFPGNQIPIDARSNAMLGSGLIPVPNSTIGCNSSLAGRPDPNTQVPLVPCYNTVISPSTYWREELFRIDHNITSNLRASFRYIHDTWDTTVVTPQWGYVTSNSFPTVQNRLNGPGLSMVARLTHTISPTLLNDFSVSYVNAHITLANIPGPGANLDPTVISRGHNPSCASACTPPVVGDVGYIFNNGFGGKLPGLIIAGTNAEYGGNGFAVDTSYMPWDHTNPTYGLADNVSKVIKTHTVQFGIQVINSQRNETNAAVGAATGDKQGLFTFSNQNSVRTTGNAFADFLYLNPVDLTNPIKSFQQDSDQLKYYNNYWVIEPYVQDDWRVNHRLTLNLGVRLSVFGNYHEKNLNAYNWVPNAFDSNLASTVQINAGDAHGQNGGYLQTNAGDPITIDPNNPLNGLNPVLTNGLVQCGKAGVPASCMSSHLFNPAPRIGFAWDPKGNGLTSIRGGYGIFFEHGTGQEANTGSLQGSAPLVLTMTSPFPSAWDTVGIGGQLSTTPSSLAYPLDVTSIPAKTVWPYVQQWSLSVQRQLPKDTLITVAYVGSKGTHLTAELQLNQLAPLTPAFDTGIFPTGNPFPLATPLTSATCSSFGAGIPNSFTVAQNGFVVTPKQPAWTNLVAACFGNAGSAVLPNPNSLRTYAPGFGRVLSLQNIADSQYHALQATLRHTNGPVTVGVSYTYSHSFDDSSDRSDASFVNSADIRSNWASSNFDQRHLLNLNYIYQLPKLGSALQRWVTGGTAISEDADSEATAPKPQTSSRFARVAFDGWQISGITVYQSGTPFSVVNGGSGNGVSVLDNAGVANGAGAGSYPDVIANPHSQYPVGVNRFNTSSIGPLLFNPAAFAAPRGLTFGNAGRNFMNNPSRLNFDMTLLKEFKVTEGSNLQFRAEAFNIFNHTQFRIFNPNLGNSASNTINCYGGPDYSAAGGLTTFPGINAPPVAVDCTTGSSFLHPVDAHRPRTIQLGLKYSF